MKAPDAEDVEQTVLFIDMLRFASLTEDFPKRVIVSRPDQNGYGGSVTGPIQNRIGSDQSPIRWRSDEVDDTIGEREKCRQRVARKRGEEQVQRN
jgi:hypothetical protein